MPKFALFFTYTPESWAKMIDGPGDRRGAVQAMTESLKGSVESLYFMFGERDGFVVLDLPDADAAAAAALVVTSTGAFRNVDTHQLIEPEHLPDVLAKAGTARGSYRLPGT